MNENKSTSALKVIFTIIGVIVSIGALALVVYTVFKKYFEVTFDCDDCCDCCECGDCEECCLFEEDSSVEPECCCCECDECADVTPEVEVVEE